MSTVIESRKSRTLELLKQKPMTPSELGIQLGEKEPMDRSYVQRAILKPLLEEGRIVIIEGTHRYQTRGQNTTARQIKLELESESELDQCETMKRWHDHCLKHKKEIEHYNTFKQITLGKVVKTFKRNPDAWNHPLDTIECVKQLTKHYGTLELNSYRRSGIRRFLKFGLKLQISKEEAKELGISGMLDNAGRHAQVSFEHGEYQKALEWFKVNKKDVDYCKFGVKFHTFCRPSVLYTIKLENMQFYDREMEFIESDGEISILSVTIDKTKTIYDKAVYNTITNSNAKILRKKDRACYISEVLEQKTETPYPKYIYDDQFVRELEKFVKQRLDHGFKYLFWDTKEEFRFEDYDFIVKTQREKDGDILKEMYQAIGIKDSYCFDHANYAMRHIGVQHWLQMTDYDYGLIAEMGWDDIETLRKWYGKRVKSAFEKKIAEYGF